MKTYPSGSGLKSARGGIAFDGTNSSTGFSVPVADTVSDSTERSVWMYASNVITPSEVVTVPRSSAFHRSRRQSTAETVPAAVSFRFPTGRRQTPNWLPPVVRWSCTSAC